MANSLFFKPTDQNPNELLRNACLVNPSGEIRTEPPQKSSGRKPGGSKTGKEKQKKQKRRGMGVARLERLRIEEERNNMVVAQGGGDTLAASPNGTRSPDPGVVLQGFPSHGTGKPNMSVGGNTRRRFPCGGVGSGQIPPWGFVEGSTHEPSLFPTPQMYNPSNNQCDACLKKQRIKEDQSVIGFNGGGFSKYTMVPHLPPPDHWSQGYFYDPRVARYSAPPSASTNQGSMEELGSGSPRNGTGDVKEYDFFPGNCGNKSVSSVSTSVGDCSPDTSTIDLSLKL